jgi:hypothetical protein
MNGHPEPEILQGDVARNLLASAPVWARAMQPRREADGRLILAGVADGCYVWVQPKAWSPMTLRDDRTEGNAALNYGLNMGAIGSHAGQLETNDARFGRELLAGNRAGSEVPMPDSSPRAAGPASGLLFPAAIVALGLVVAALIARLKRRAS